MKSLLGSIKQFVSMVKRLLFILSKEQKKKSIFVFVNMFISSLLDTLGVAAILPFISALTNVEHLKKQKYIQTFICVFKIKSDTQLMVSIGLVIMLIYIIKNVYQYTYQCIQIRYQCAVKKDVSVLMLNSYMSRSYSFFRNTNSSVIMRGIDKDAEAVYYTLSNLFTIMSQTLTIILIGIFLIRQDLIMALGIILASVLCVIIIALGLKSKSSMSGREYSESNVDRVGVSYQIINGIKEIFVMQRQKTFARKYEKAYTRYCDSIVAHEEVIAAPVRIIEAVFVSFVIGVVCIKLSLGMNAEDFVPQLATFAVAGFRMIPMVTSIPSCMSELIFWKPMLNDAYDNIKTAREYTLLHREEIDIKQDMQSSISFKNCLEIKNLSYCYEDGDKKVLDDLSLTIRRGESIGISTLVDIIMGLQRPSGGSITVDGNNIFAVPHQWAGMIGYIPQSIFLLDDTVKNNVLFGEDENNDEKVLNSLDEAHIKSFVENMPQGMNTVVGEQGIKLSGGQRQRIAIARVMYNDPSIIVMDEATSALDNDTESAVMESVDSMQGNKTLIIVAHRLTTIRNCNHIYELKDGKLFERTYNELVSK